MPPATQIIHTEGRQNPYRLYHHRVPMLLADLENPDHVGAGGGAGGGGGGGGGGVGNGEVEALAAIERNYMRRLDSIKELVIHEMESLMSVVYETVRLNLFHTIETEGFEGVRKHEHETMDACTEQVSRWLYSEVDRLMWDIVVPLIEPLLPPVGNRQGPLPPMPPQVNHNVDRNNNNNNNYNYNDAVQAPPPPILPPQLNDVRACLYELTDRMVDRTLDRQFFATLVASSATSSSSSSTPATITTASSQQEQQSIDVTTNEDQSLSTSTSTLDSTSSSSSSSSSTSSTSTLSDNNCCTKTSKQMKKVTKSMSCKLSQKWRLSLLEKRSSSCHQTKSKSNIIKRRKMMKKFNNNSTSTTNNWTITECNIECNSSDGGSSINIGNEQ